MSNEIIDLGHIWVTYGSWPACVKCGIVKRKDGKNSECKGIVKIKLRESESPAGGK